mmetsp:Transcript_6480/g.13345  ORF Transcript_6480/g.13345 Transcript_6480/m.13345 type:complete len:99 (+) Transcript_6480:930-1226(+)
MTRPQRPWPVPHCPSHPLPQHPFHQPQVSQDFFILLPFLRKQTLRHTLIQAHRLRMVFRAWHAQVPHSFKVRKSWWLAHLKLSQMPGLGKRVKLHWSA